MSNINALKRYILLLHMGFIDINDTDDMKLAGVKNLEFTPNPEIEEVMYGILEEYSLYDIKENFGMDLKEYMSLHIYDREFLLKSSKKIGEKKAKLLKGLGLDEEDIPNNR